MSSLKEWRVQIQDALDGFPPDIVKSIRHHLAQLASAEDRHRLGDSLNKLSATGKKPIYGTAFLIPMLSSVVESILELSRLMKEHAQDIGNSNPLPGDDELRRIKKFDIEEVVYLYASGPTVRPKEMESLDQADCPITAFLLEASRRAAPPLDHVDWAFQDKFVGGVVDDLDEHLTEQRPYDHVPVFAVLQSSGTGKTRAVMQLCHKRLGLYTCIRHNPIMASGNSTSAELRKSAPSQDQEVYEHLVPEGVRTRHRHRDADDNDNEGFENTGQALIAVASWLWAFATEFAGFIKEQNPELDDCWASFVQRTSAVLMKDITPGFRLRPESAGTKPLTSRNRSSRRDTLLLQIQQSAAKQRLVLDDLRRSTGEELNRALAETLREPFEVLQDLIKDEYCFLAIDEAISMTKTRLTELRKLMSFYPIPKFRVLLLDTNHKVVELTDIEDSSTFGRTDLRTKLHKLILPPPFTAMPQDVFLLQSYGKPLLNDPYYAWGLDLDGPGAFRRTTPLLFYRLTGYDLVLASISDLKKIPANVIIAAASQRLPLDNIGMKDTQSAMQSIKKQVSHHMRTIHSIETVGGEIQTGVPSEPLLSLAVAREFREEPDFWWSHVVNALVNDMTTQRLNHSRNGEELARSLMSYAMDKSVKNAKPKVDRLGQKNASTFVKVTDFLQELLGPTEWSNDLLEWADTHWLNFTHYAQLAERFTLDDVAPPTLLPQAWTRQAALLGTVDQQDVDCIVPVYFSATSPTGNFRPDQVDAIAVQVKNRLSQSVGDDEITKNRYTCFVRERADTGRIRGFNLYLNLTAESAATADMTPRGGSPCVLVKGAGPDQFPLLANFSVEVVEKLAILVGHSRRKTKYPVGSPLDLLTADGALWIARAGMDPLLGTGQASGKKHVDEDTDAPPELGLPDADVGKGKKPAR